MSVPESERIFRAISADPFAELVGIEYQEVRPGYGRTALTVTPAILNAHGIPHGGAIFSLADSAFAAASNSHGQVAVALSMSINFLGAAAVGTRLVAEARELRKGRRAGFYQITVATEAGEPIAVCQAVVHRKTTPLLLPDEAASPPRDS
jgi:acyl-CoA thioesterase